MAYPNSRVELTSRRAEGRRGDHHRCEGAYLPRHASGKPVRMRDGVAMEGKDGAKYLHRNDLI